MIEQASIISLVLKNTPIKKEPITKKVESYKFDFLDFSKV
jgi:hypothetical protein